MNFSIVFLIMLIGSAGLSYDIQLDEVEDIICLSEIVVDEPEPISVDVMPVSEYLRPYNMTKTRLIHRAINGSSYIDPNHEVVQWYARNTFLNDTGLYYLNGEIVRPKYYPDLDCGNEDYWMNADYYLSHNLTGDCEDLAIGIASILEAKGIPNMFVAVSDRKDYRHFYVQYYYNDEYYTADLATNPRYQLREDNMKFELQKLWMFNIDNDYMIYRENWIEVL